MLALTCERAGVTDGMRILDLGCGWGSLSLWLAERYPACSVVGVSNSAPQRTWILSEAARRGLDNVSILTADVNTFAPAGPFDRVLSVEMFEHMRNYELLFAKIASWLRDDGLLFTHVFAHREFAYPFEVRDETDWMAQHFFSGGLMPSEDLFSFFEKDMRTIAQWRVNGMHYCKTAEAWLKNMDARKDEILPLFERTYGTQDARRWWVRWRIFFMACAELWGYRGGEEWVVSHSLFSRSDSRAHVTVTRRDSPSRP
jgi:cyclopropane-fatty-acyl-phospholipid synthase